MDLLDDTDDWLHLAYVEGNDKAARSYAGKGFEYVRTEPDPDGWPAQVWLRLPCRS